MPKITTLELEIKQTITNSRSTALEKLAERLNTLKTALTSMGNLNAEVTALKNLADTVSELGSTTRDASSFSSSINRMSKAIETMSQAADKVDSLSAAFRGVAEASANINENAFDRMSFATDTMQASALNVSRFSRALDSVGSSSQGVYSSMGRLTALFEGIGHASEAIDTTKLEQLDSASMSLKHSGSGIASFGRAIDSVGTSMEEMQVKAGRLEMFFYGLQDAAGAIDPARLAPIAQIAQMIGAAASGLNRFTGALGKLSEFAQSSDKVTQVFQLIDNLIGRLASRQAELAQLAASLTAITAGLRAMNHAGDIGQKMDAAQKSTHGFRISLDSAIKSGGKLVNAGWDKLKSKITGLLGPVTNLWHSFKRIAGYRALRAAIRAITQGFKQGIEHLYQWSALVGNSFKQSMDSIATSAHYLRDSLGAMASPLLDALAPALEILIDKFVSLLNIANQFFAALTGKDTWRKAVRTPTEWKAATDEATDSTKKATEAQKKLNKALMDFDEIHLLTTSTTKGSNPSSPSGSGGGSGIDSTHFEEVPIASWIQDIKDAIDNGDWYGAGKLLADKLNGMLDSFDAKAFGEKIGEKVENGLKFYLGFMDNFHWETLGIKAGDFINGILSKIDPNDLGRAMVAKFQAALKFLGNFLKTVDLSPLGTAFGVAFNELFSAETMQNLAKSISGAINNAIGIAYNFITTADLGKAAFNIMDGLFTAIKDIDWAKFGSTVGKIGISLINAIKEAIGYAITHIDVVLQAIWDFVGALLGELWNYLLDGIGGLLKEFWQYVKDNFWSSGADDGNGRKDSPASMSGSYGTGYAAPSVTPEGSSDTLSWTEKIKKNLEEINGKDYKVKLTDSNNGIKNSATNAGNLVGNKCLGGLKSSYSSKVSVNGLSGAASNVDKLLQMGKLKKSYTTDLIFKTSVTTAKGGSSRGTTKSLLTKNQLVKVLNAYAEGGFPSDDLTQGSLFVAGEMPGQAEMVGNINGKTGVASGKEITGISDAVYSTGETEAALLREQNSLLRQLLAKKSEVTLAPNVAAGKWVNQAQAAYARATG